jgi:hypothetical protein
LPRGAAVRFLLVADFVVDVDFDRRFVAVDPEVVMVL